MYGGSTLVTGEEALRKPGTVGRPRYGPPRIVDEDGRAVGIGEVGLIYFERPEEPNYHYLGAESQIVDGWETLGDMGYVDEDGYLFLADRRVDMIISGGENVYPAEVEAALDQHPDVRSSVVIGLPDDDLGQRVHAIVDVGGHDGSSGRCRPSRPGGLPGRSHRPLQDPPDLRAGQRAPAHRCRQGATVPAPRRKRSPLGD